jgi:hypothetical protein
MEPEQFSSPESETTSDDSLSTPHEGPPIFKVVAMLLFIILPFIGGWVGYTFAPEKIIEVEKIVYLEPEPETSVIPAPDVAAELSLSEPEPSETEAESVDPESTSEATESGASMFTTSAKPSTVTENLPSGLRRTVEQDFDRTNVTETYAPEFFPLNPSIFADDRSNASQCLYEWDEVIVNIPSEINNLLLRPVDGFTGRIGLLLNSEASTISIANFSLYAVPEGETATYSYRWRYGDVDNDFFDFVPDDLHRYRILFEFPRSTESFEGTEMVGAGNGFISHRVDSEVFVVRDCGTSL